MVFQTDRALISTLYVLSKTPILCLLKHTGLVLYYWELVDELEGALDAERDIDHNCLSLTLNEKKLEEMRCCF
jgi:hypothetical protein